MKGDRVIVGMGSVQVSKENIPVYQLNTDATGKVIYDQNGAASPKVAGGAIGGSRGVIAGDNVKVMRGTLVGGNIGASMGVDYAIVILVYLDHYQTTAYVQSEHVHLTGQYDQH